MWGKAAPATCSSVSPKSSDAVPSGSECSKNKLYVLSVWISFKGALPFHKLRNTRVLHVSGNSVTSDADKNVNNSVDNS